MVLQVSNLVLLTISLQVVAMAAFEVLQDVFCLIVLLGLFAFPWPIIFFPFNRDLGSRLLLDNASWMDSGVIDS